MHRDTPRHCFTTPPIAGRARTMTCVRPMVRRSRSHRDQVFPKEAGCEPLPAMTNQVTSVMDARACGTCTLCCRLPEIDQLSKPANALCVNCVTGQGCLIYDDRPGLCRDFLCAWMTDPKLGPQWDPVVAKMMVYGQGDQLTVLVDPDHPQSWREEPYASQ